MAEGMRGVIEADLAWYKERERFYRKMVQILKSPHFRAATRGMRRRVDETILKAFSEGV